MLSFVLRATFMYIYIYIYIQCNRVAKLCGDLRFLRGIKCFRASVRINGNLVEGERLGSFVLLVRI